MSDAPTVPVEVRIIGHEAVKGRGTLIALVIVELDIAGVMIRLQAVEIHQSRLGKLTIAAPQIRAANGKRYPAVVMPPEIMQTTIELFIAQHMEMER